MSGALLSVRSLSAGYGRRVVVREASFEVMPGRLMALLGSNGCGKTTLLKTAIGLLPALGGEALLAGRSVPSLGPRARALSVSWVPQVAEPAWSYVVRDFVAQGRYAVRGPFEAFNADDRAAVDEALRSMDAAGLERRLFSSLSGGEQRRVLIARALAQGAPLLALDEPAAHLDPGRQMELMETLRRLADSGAGVAVSVHDVNAARRWADDVLLIGRDGSAVFGSPDEALTPERLEEAYDTEFIYGRHDAYGKFVLPLSRRKTKKG